MNVTREVIAISFGFLFMMMFGIEMHNLAEKYRYWARTLKPPHWLTREKMNLFMFLILIQMFLAISLTFILLTFLYKT